MSTIIATTQCKHCSKFKPHLEIWLMPGGAAICPDCQQWHDNAIDELSKLLTGIAPGCPVCRKTSDELSKMAGGGDYPMYIHQRDGIYIPHCDSCNEQYAPKRRDLYGGTKFGEDLKIR